MRKKSGFTIVEQAIVLVTDFEKVVRKLEQQVTLRGQSKSTGISELFTFKPASSQFVYLKLPFYRQSSKTNWRCCNEELRLDYPLQPALHLHFVIWRFSSFSYHKFNINAIMVRQISSILCKMIPCTNLVILHFKY